MIAGYNREQEEFNPANLTPGMRKYIADREALVRKETIEDILQLQVFWGTKRKNMEMIEEWRVDVDDIKEYAQSKGITL